MANSMRKHVVTRRVEYFYELAMHSVPRLMWHQGRNVDHCAGATSGHWTITDLIVHTAFQNPGKLFVDMGVTWHLQAHINLTPYHHKAFA
jgi:hypothetical protein